MADHVRGAGPPPGGMIRPMLATPGPVPTSDGWAFEVKFDGVRAVGYAGGAGMRLFSRNDREITASYPELSGVDLGEEMVVDGELIALDERGRPDFAQLQHRMHVLYPAAGLIARVPVQYVVFDVLRHRERPVFAEPYRHRRALLAGLDLDRHPGIRAPANFTDTAGSTVLAAVDQQGLEGVVAKRLDSVYQPGRRSRSWIKTAIRRTHDVIIAGWAAGTGRPDSLGALLLAAHDAGRLVYVGDVGTGFTDTARDLLLRRLSPLHRPDPPFAGDFVRARGWSGRGPRSVDVHWAQPRLVGAISFRSFTRDGYFRHPSWQGLRPEVDPAAIRLPPPD